MEQLNHRYTIKDGKVYDADTQTEVSQREICLLLNFLFERVVELENRLKEKDELLRKTLTVNDNLTKRLLESEDAKR